MENSHANEPAFERALPPPAIEYSLSLGERLELALEAADDAVVWTDSDGRVQWCNARFAAVALAPRDKIVGSLLVDLLPLKPIGGEPLGENPVVGVLKGRTRLSAGCVLEKDGGTTHWQLNGSWITPAKEAPMAVFWLHEVTKQVLAQRDANRFAATQSATQEAVVCWGLDGVITHWNAAAQRIYGYDQQETLGKPFTMLVPEDERARLAEILARVRQGETLEAHEVERRRMDGRRVRVVATLRGWLDEEGRLCGFVHVSRDVTEQRRAECVLAHQMEELVRSNRQLEEFASTVSHDLLAPLRKIIAFGGLLGKRSAAELDEQGRDFLGRITQSASRMTRLIEDLLQFSRVFGDDLPLEDVHLNAIVSEVLSDLEIQIARAQAVVDVAALPTVRARPVQMRQLFQNLIANAVKFSDKTRPPRVTIDCKHEYPGFVDVSVRDNGIGFDEKDAEKIFEPFTRLHARAEYEGSGIGLAVCRRVVLRHGGWISAKSEPGHGSVFTVSLPSQESKTAPPPLYSRDDGGILK